MDMWPEVDQSEVPGLSFRISVRTTEKEKFSFAWDCREDAMGASNSYSHLSSRRGLLLVGGARRGNQSPDRESETDDIICASRPICSRNQSCPWLFSPLNQWVPFSYLARFRFILHPGWPTKWTLLSARASNHKAPKHKQCPLPPCALVSFLSSVSLSEPCISFMSFICS